MYTVADYGHMVNDRNRMDAYHAALKSVVTPDSVIVDIGAGAGIFSLLACQFGARKVYAIESNEAINVARASARANGFSDKIGFFQADSLKVELPEKADVVVSDLRGSLPLYENHIDIIKDARMRFLKPGGTMIPRRDSLWAAIVRAPAQFKGCNEPWMQNDFDLDLANGAPYVFNTALDGPVSSDCVVTEPQCWAMLDYANIEQSSVSGNLLFRAAASHEAHGINLWFDTELCDGVGYSNAPNGADTIYGQTLLPWPQAVNLESGDKAKVALRADHVNNEYIWFWKTEIRRGNNISHKFDQSTFAGALVSADQLRKKRGDFTPRLNDRGEVAQVVLSLMGSGLTLENIAQHICQRFPGQFGTTDDALVTVGEFSHRYSE